jgi:tetratricopeptide (TPR) repeat protein
MQYNTVVSQKNLNVTDVCINVGVIYLKQGQYDLAIQYFDKVLVKDPENKVAKQMKEEALVAQQK